MPGASAGDPCDRLFFALWPDEEHVASIAGRLSSLVAAPGARLQRPDQWHVTLEFLGQVPRSRQPLLHEAAAVSASATQSFAVRFDRLEHWRKPRVLCLVGDAPTPLLRLVTALRSALAQRGLEPDARDFRPHVTLARKVRRAAEGPVAPALDWPADAVVLVRSMSEPGGSRYEPLARWNLVRAAR